MPKELKFDYPYLEDFGGTTRRFLDTLPGLQDEWSVFNPSVGCSPESGYAVLLRSSNYSITELGIPSRALSAIKNDLWFSELDENLAPTNLRKISVNGDIPLFHGVEDARLLWRDGAWHFLAVVYDDNRITRLNLFRLSPDDNNAKHLEEFPSWESTRLEKNWMATAVDTNPNFDFIYSATGIVKDRKIILSPVEDEMVGEIRGGSALWDLEDGSYLAVVHTVYYTKKVTPNPEGEGFFKSYIRNYTHQLARYDNYGKLIEISEEFVFDGPGVEFAAGLVEKDGDFIISYGREDSSANLAIISKNDALSLLGPVGDDFD
jgi:hypothetical protein